MNNIQLKAIVKMAKIAVVLKLLVLIVGIVITITLGPPPSNTLEFFEMFSNSKLVGLLRAESYNLILIFLYTFSVLGMFFLLKEHQYALSLYSIIAVYFAVILTLGSHSGFSMMNLSDQYYATSDIIIQERLLAAGDAVLSKNMWASTAGFFSGILLQGGSILICIAMIRSNWFSKITIISGILCNSLDLMNHFIHFAYPQIANVLLAIAGPLYIVWFIFLIKDFSKSMKKINGGIIA